MDDVARTNQKRLVLSWMLVGEKITQQYATARGVERLGARIWDLKRQWGLSGLVKDKWVSVCKKTTGKSAKVKCYYIELPDRPMALHRLMARGIKTNTHHEAAEPVQNDTVAKAASQGLLIGDVDQAVGYD